MVSQDSAIRPAEVEAVAAHQSVAAGRTVPKARLLAAVVILAVFALDTAAHAATITVTTLSDPAGPSGTCSLRNAITAANTMTMTNGCAAGTGNDTIQFNITGTIALGSKLPQIIDSKLSINGPASPGITIDGRGAVQVMEVASDATLNLSRLTVAHGSGHFIGGIYNDGTLTVTNSTFSGNDASGGGGILNSFVGTLTVTNSTFAGNNASEGGGIYNGGALTVTNSTFSGNEAAGGGGIENFGTLTITNSIFAGNDASEGGGIDNFDTLTVTNSTFSDNSGAGGFGGISNEWSASLKSTIMSASSCVGTITDAGYNISDDDTCAFTATGSRNSTNPMLDPNGLRNNGGPTQTIALLPGSPAIDAIPLADCTDQASQPNPIITDQRRFPRPDTADGNCDIGAYEHQDAAFIHFSYISGKLTIGPGAKVFLLAGGFRVGAGGSLDPTTQLAAFSLGSYAIRLPVGSFVKYPSGYVCQKTVNGIFLFIYLKFTSRAGQYQLFATGSGTKPLASTSPVPVTLIIGQNGGSALMKATFYQVRTGD
jgi:CSLREA domain-containing protein